MHQSGRISESNKQTFYQKAEQVPEMCCFRKFCLKLFLVFRKFCPAQKNRKAHSFSKFWPYWITSLKYYKVTRSIWKLTSPPTLDPKVGCPQKFPLQPENNQSLDGTKNPNIIQRLRSPVREAVSYGIRHISLWFNEVWRYDCPIFLFSPGILYNSK